MNNIFVNKNKPISNIQNNYFDNNLENNKFKFKCKIEQEKKFIIEENMSPIIYKNIFNNKTCEDPDIYNLIKAFNPKNRKKHYLYNYMYNLNYFREYLSNIFIDYKTLLSSLIDKINYEHCYKNNVLFRVDDIGENFYVILKGSIKILVIKQTKYILTTREYVKHLLKLRLYDERCLLKRILENSENYKIFPIYEVDFSRIKPIDNTMSNSLNYKLSKNTNNTICDYINKKSFLNYGKNINDLNSLNVTSDNDNLKFKYVKDHNNYINRWANVFNIDYNLYLEVYNQVIELEINKYKNNINCCYTDKLKIIKDINTSNNINITNIVSQKDVPLIDNIKDLKQLNSLKLIDIKRTNNNRNSNLTSKDNLLFLSNLNNNNFDYINKSSRVSVRKSLFEYKNKHLSNNNLALNISKNNDEIVSTVLSNKTNKNNKKECFNFELNDKIKFNNKKKMLLQKLSSEETFEFIMYEYSIINHLYKGMNFGEIALQDNNRKRTATVICSEECLFGVINKHIYLNSLATANKKFKTKNIEYFVCNFPFFSGINNTIFERHIYFKTIYKKVKNNEYIMNQNKKCNDVIFLKSGEYLIYFNGTINEADKLLNQYLLEIKLKNKTCKELNSYHKNCLKELSNNIDDENNIRKVSKVEKYLIKNFNDIYNNYFLKEVIFKLKIVANINYLGFSEYINNNISLFNVVCKSKEGEIFTLNNEVSYIC